MDELDEYIKLGSKIWAGVPDNFVSDLRGYVMDEWIDGEERHCYFDWHHEGDIVIGEFSDGSVCKFKVSIDEYFDGENEYPMLDVDGIKWIGCEPKNMSDLIRFKVIKDI